MAKGIESTAVEDVFNNIVVKEMKHAEQIAERLAYLGEMTTTKPDPILAGERLKEMLRVDAKAEEEAIALYRQIIEVADKERDSTCRRLIEDILAEEGEHYDTFTRLLEK